MVPQILCSFLWFQILQFQRSFHHISITIFNWKQNAKGNQKPISTRNHKKMQIYSHFLWELYYIILTQHFFYIAYLSNCKLIAKWTLNFLRQILKIIIKNVHKDEQGKAASNEIILSFITFIKPTIILKKLDNFIKLGKIYEQIHKIKQDKCGTKYTISIP